MVHLAIIIMLMVRILGMAKMMGMEMEMLVVRMLHLVFILVGDSVLKLLVAALSSILDLESALIAMSTTIF